MFNLRYTLIKISGRKGIILSFLTALCSMLYAFCFAFDHSAWTNELKKYVSAEGKVNYAEWVKDTVGIDLYLKSLSDSPPQNIWHKNEKLAYWINAYNAFTIKLVLDHYPIQSIRDLDNGKVWERIWITLGSDTYSLNQIENEIIRIQFTEPRIHFALNCAAKSCPPLLNEAFETVNVDAQLDKQAKRFINNPQFNEINSTGIKISKLFSWYKGDFKPDLITFLNRYLSIPITDGTKVEYLPYDWGLNE